MEFLCHASATDHVAPLKDPHAQSRHAEIRCTGQAIVTGTDYDGIEIGHGFAIKTGWASKQYRSCPRSYQSGSCVKC